MSARLVAGLAVFALACGAGGPGAPSSAATCDGPAPATILSGMDAYDAIAVSGGFVYVEIPGSGVGRCATSGCTQPTSVVESDAFVSASLGGASIAYVTQIASPDDGSISGEVRTTSDDGSGDASLLENAASPAFVATSGARAFWAKDSFALDETPSEVDCIGCGGSGSTPWITGIQGGTYGMLADGANVYVLADDPTLTSVTLYACSVSAPCGSSPRVALTGLDQTMGAPRLASDGANVYVARAADVVRVDAAGNVTTVLPEAATAIAVDPSGALYAAVDGGVVRVENGAQTMVACTTEAIGALALDDTRVYLLAGDSGSYVLAAAK